MTNIIDSLPFNQAIEASMRKIVPINNPIKVEVWLNEQLKGIVEGRWENDQIVCTIPGEMTEEYGTVELRIVD